MLELRGSGDGPFRARGRKDHYVVLQHANSNAAEQGKKATLNDCRPSTAFLE
jgi:hypothetical protein